MKFYIVSNKEAPNFYLHWDLNSVGYKYKRYESGKGHGKKRVSTEWRGTNRVKEVSRKNVHSMYERVKII